MNCEACEKQMYLFSELTSAEKRAVEDHITGCPSCALQFRMLQDTAALVQRASAEPVLPSNHGQLTGKIMNRVQHPQQTSGASLIMWLLDRPMLRYSMAVVSLVMVLEFVGEQQLSDFSEQAIKTTTTSNTIILDTQQFLKKVQERRNTSPTERRFSLMQHVKDHQTKRF